MNQHSPVISAVSPGLSQAGEDARFMQAAIALSSRSLGLSAPNPSVGVLIIRKEGLQRIIVGRGVTAPGGRPHAERLALDQAGEFARGATMYVTLEPCARRSIARDGPSCTDAALAAGIARVVIGASDPSPFAAGQGATRLQAHGIEVVTGVEEPAARRVNLGHILRVSQHRPMVTFKLAQTADGFAGTVDHKPLVITGEEARRRAHMMRAQSDAIAVGISTVLADDPALTVRLPGLENRSPVRVVFDSHLRLPLQSSLVKTARDVPVWVITNLSAPAERERDLVARGVEVMRAQCPLTGKVDLRGALGLLADRGITRLMVEGGPAIADAFAEAGLIDELALFTAPWSAGEGLAAISPELERFMQDCKVETMTLGMDQLQIFQTKE